MEIPARRKRPRTLRRSAFGLALIAVVTVAAGASAQTPPPADGAPQMIPHSDPTFGFSIQLPAGWNYDRTRYPGPGDSIGLLRGNDLSGRQTLELLMYRRVRQASFPDWIADFEKKIASLSGVQRVESKPYQTGERTGAQIVVDLHIGGVMTRSHYLCAPYDAHNIWVLVFASQFADSYSATIAGQFDQMARSLRIDYNPADAEELARAFSRGRELMDALRDDRESIEFDERARFYEIRLGRESIGYLTRQLAAQTRSLDDPRSGGNRKSGLRVTERSWRFSDDGTARHVHLDLFCSDDLRSEVIENRTYQIPPKESGLRTLIKLDQCLRENETMFSSFSTNLDAGLPEPMPTIHVRDTYLGLSWLRLLPKLLLDAPPELHAFTIYDSGTRAIMTLTIRRIGPTALPGDDTQAILFETREGFAGAPTKVYIDETGAVLREEAGELVIQRATGQEMEARFAKRQGEAEARFLAPAAQQQQAPRRK